MESDSNFRALSVMTQDTSTDIFEQHRPKLMGIAYRFLGAVSDAEDVVQDVYIKWSQADHSAIDKSEAWLNKVCTRRCLDIVKSLEKTRIDYVGTWLPEPIFTTGDTEDTILELFFYCILCSILPITMWLKF